MENFMLSPKEQYIIYNWFGITLELTNVILYLIIASTLVFLLSKGICTSGATKIVTNNWK
jgi:hypothetical protein